MQVYVGMVQKMKVRSCVILSMSAILHFCIGYVFGGFVYNKCKLVCSEHDVLVRVLISSGLVMPYK